MLGRTAISLLRANASMSDAEKKSQSRKYKIPYGNGQGSYKEHVTACTLNKIEGIM